jgi:hypothetical protein
VATNLIFLARDGGEQSIRQSATPSGARLRHHHQTVILSRARRITIGSRQSSRVTEHTEAGGGAANFLGFICGLPLPAGVVKQWD